MGSDYQLGTFFGGPRARRLDYRVTSHVDLQRARAADRARARSVPRAAAGKQPARARVGRELAHRSTERRRDRRARDGLPALATVPVHADAARARRTARRRVPVRDARRLLRALRFGTDGVAARRRPAGARRHGLSGRRVEHDGRLLHRPTVRRARLDRSLARGRRLGARRRRRRGRTRARRAGVRPFRQRRRHCRSRGTARGLGPPDRAPLGRRRNALASVGHRLRPGAAARAARVARLRRLAPHAALRRAARPRRRRDGRAAARPQPLLGVAATAADGRRSQRRRASRRSCAT